MKIKETTYIVISEKGQVIKRTTHKTIIHDSPTDRGYDYGTRHSFAELPISSLRRVMEAYEDYCDSRE